MYAELGLFVSDGLNRLDGQSPERRGNAGCAAQQAEGNGTNAAGDPMSLKTLIIWGVVVAIVSVVDYVVPMYFTKVTGGSKYAERGAMAGLILGIIFTPVGMILGSFLGAFLAELYYTRQGAVQALKAAIGSFLGFITGTGLKTIVACLIMWKIIVYL